MKSLAFASIKNIQEAIATKDISTQEVVNYFLQRIGTHDPVIQSSLEVFEEQTISAECATGPLAGIPGLIKDNICQKGRVVSCASKMLETYTSPYDATVVDKLKKAGAPILGRANCDEFAMGSSGETSAYKLTKNPWDTSRVPGGSSSGSAACVAAGLVPWALGSDTGGSVRQPAAYCGVVGIKPTYGLVSRYGLIAYASSLDTIGVFARTVHDNATVFSHITGSDAYDSTALSSTCFQDYTQNLTGKIKPGLKIGVIDVEGHDQGMHAGTQACYSAAIKELERLGAQVERVKISSMQHGAAVYFMVSRSEAASNLARFDGVRYGVRNKEVDALQDMYDWSRHDGFGHEVKRRILIGNYVLSQGHAEEFYSSAKVVQRMIRRDFYKAFEKFDVLFAPTVSSPAFKFGAYADNALLMDLQDYYTASVNLAGIPAISVPCGFTENMPVGFQLIGPDLSEGLLYQTAYAYEQSMNWHKQYPDLG